MSIETSKSECSNASDRDGPGRTSLERTLFYSKLVEFYAKAHIYGLIFLSIFTPRRYNRKQFPTTLYLTAKLQTRRNNWIY